MALKISELPQALSPLSDASFVPVVVNGITRKTALSRITAQITGGTVDQLSSGQNITISSNPSQLSRTISFKFPGLILPFCGPSALLPEGWVFCNGASYNTYLYRELHAVISNNFGGTAYSAGTSDVFGVTTTFNVPDLRGRIPYGKSPYAGAGSALDGAAFSFGNPHTINSSGGEENHLLLPGQAAVKIHAHTASGTITIKGGANDTACWDDNDCRPPECFHGYQVHGAVSAGSRRTTYSSPTSPAFTGVNAAVPHNNMPPAMVLGYIIKY